MVAHATWMMKLIRCPLDQAGMEFSREHVPSSQSDQSYLVMHKYTSKVTCSWHPPRASIEHDLYDAPC